MHWAGMTVAIWLVIPLAVRGRLDWEAVSLVILIIVALGWYLAGVHLDRPMLWLGLLMAVGYVVLLFVNAYTWTILGALMAIGLVASALLTGRTHAAEED